MVQEPPTPPRDTAPEDTDDPTRIHDSKPPPPRTMPLPIAPGPTEIPMRAEIRLRHNTGSKRKAYNPRRQLQLTSRKARDPN